MELHLFFYPVERHIQIVYFLFCTQRVGDEMIAAKVGGDLTSFTQTGLVAGQKYKVLIRGGERWEDGTRERQ